LEGFRYGFERLWERVIGLADRAGGLLYVLAIKGDFKRHQVALDSSKRESNAHYALLW
jgi:hypothetical protein